MSLIEELKRRNVFRVGLAYLVVAWLVAQVADLVLDSFNAPSWVMQTILVLLALGLPVTLFLAWVFELTPEGIKKESDIDRNQSITPNTGKKLNAIIIATLLVAVGFLLVDKFVLQRQDAQTVLSTAPKSIAVLPFVNMSSDPEQEYFSDGITEEILNALAKVRQLKVAGRTSSFAFKGKLEDLRQIGESLGVDHVLEGSVRKAAGQVRVTVQLIKVDDGFHLWSEVYDGSLSNIFDLQENISRQVADELKLVLNISDSVRLASKMTKSIDAYDLFLRGREHVRARLGDNIPKGIGLLKQAVKLDPQFAEAWAVLAEAEAVSGGYLDVDLAQSSRRAREYIETAKTIDSSLVLPYSANALLMASALEQDYQGAIEELERARALEPNNALTLRWLGGMYQILGYFDKARPLLEKAAVLEPLSRAEAWNLASNRLNTGDLKGAERYFGLVNQLSGYMQNSQQAYVLAFLGEKDAAVELFLQHYSEDVERFGVDAFFPLEHAEKFALGVLGGDEAMKQEARELRKNNVALFENAGPWYIVFRDIQLGEFDRAFRILYERPNFFETFSADFMWYRLPNSDAFRADPRFPLLLEHYGIADDWRALGWPDSCSPHEGTDGSAGQFSCR
ncbi:MAG: hypothetical protein AB8F65_08470 [Woeseiaceae bacterium]